MEWTDWNGSEWNMEMKETDMDLKEHEGMTICWSDFFNTDREIFIIIVVKYTENAHCSFDDDFIWYL